MKGKEIVVMDSNKKNLLKGAFFRGFKKNSRKEKIFRKAQEILYKNNGYTAVEKKKHKTDRGNSSNFTRRKTKT